MKPMAALITTGIVLLLIMLYFGNKSFEGTFEIGRASCRERV